MSESCLAVNMRRNPYFGIFPWHPLNQGLVYSSYEAIYTKDPRKRLCIRCGKPISTRQAKDICDDCQRCLRLALQREKLRQANLKIREEMKKEQGQK